MAIEYIPFQPINFIPLSDNIHNDKGSCLARGDGYCMPYEKSDSVYFQVKGGENNCNIISNGDFDSSTDWNFGGNWKYDSNNNRAKQDDTAIGEGDLKQGGVFSTGTRYKVKLTVFKGLVQQGNTFCFGFYNDNKLIHEEGAEGETVIEFTFVAQSDGDFIIALTDCNDNKLTSTNDYPNDVWVDDIEICALTSLAYVIEDLDGNEQKRVKSDSNKITAADNTDHILAEVDLSDLDEGCYQIKTSDASQWKDEKIVDTDFQKKGAWVWGSNWVHNTVQDTARLAGIQLVAEDTITGNGSKKTFIAEHNRFTKYVMPYAVRVDSPYDHVELNYKHINDHQVEINFNIAPDNGVKYRIFFYTYDELWQKLATDMVSGITYDIELEITNYQNDAIDVGIYNVNSEGELIDEKIIMSGLNSNGVKTASFSFNDIATRNVIAIIPSGGHPTKDTNVSLDIKYVTVTGNEPSDLSNYYDRKSDCLNVKETHSCSKLLTWKGDDNGLGFNYNDFDFEFALRTFAAVKHPSYPKEKTVFTDANGDRTIIKSRTAKSAQLTIEEVPEFVHDAIAIGLENDHFYVDGTEYIFEEENYEPTWRRSSLLAPAEIEIIEDKVWPENTNC